MEAAQLDLCGQLIEAYVPIKMIAHVGSDTPNLPGKQTSRRDSRRWHRQWRMGTYEVRAEEIERLLHEEAGSQVRLGYMPVQRAQNMGTDRVRLREAGNEFNSSAVEPLLDKSLQPGVAQH